MNSNEQRECLCCNKKIYIGDEIDIFKDSFIRNLEKSCNMALRKTIPEEIVKHIFSFIPSELSNTIGHKHCCAINHSKTRYGRICYAPIKFSEITFTSGSGFNGCDRYDAGYDRCSFYDNEEFDNTYDDLDGFIVDDYTSESDNNDDDEFL